jgi:hypothetical protein
MTIILARHKGRKLKSFNSGEMWDKKKKERGRKKDAYQNIARLHP